MMAKARTVSDDIREAQQADKVSLPSPDATIFDGKSYDELVALSEILKAKIEQIRGSEIEKFRTEMAERARKLGLPVPEFGTSIAKKSQSKSGGQPQVPPEGVELFTNPANPDQKWWQGKKGKKPAWAG
ncbi:hypothetical protein GCM10007874_58660 [Labrys miyagiensis]|uniref:H-NS histone family protein n=1 Tax=Labrys miyagiensis TaxID=346912 RepID=A0ABQ6CR72_9HYPH|nr:H-NS family nucleoid-associated regulatory protein [Labrys miyagiensis]GLS22846.1 hypothetical protein GCM10007874_58660 [Labrys miyagiensis]